VTDIGSELISTGSDVQAAVDAGTALAKPTEVPEGAVMAFALPAGGKVHVIDQDLDKYREHPRRKVGTVTVHDAGSFVEYLAKHALGETEVYADLDGRRVVAVLNAHMGVTDDGVEDYAGWSDHRLTLRLSTTPAWDAWLKLNGRLAGQLQLAEHFEDRLPDFVTPAGAEMLEVAQSFTANRSVRFESSRRVKSGETTLVYVEDTEARAGRKGDLTIPDTFELALVPFEGSDPYRVKARLRYRINDGALVIGYTIERPEDVLRAAFLDVVDTIATASGRTVLRGTPA